MIWSFKIHLPAPNRLSKCVAYQKVFWSCRAFVPRQASFRLRTHKHESCESDCRQEAIGYLSHLVTTHHQSLILPDMISFMLCRIGRLSFEALGQAYRHVPLVFQNVSVTIVISLRSMVLGFKRQDVSRKPRLFA